MSIRKGVALSKTKREPMPATLSFKMPREALNTLVSSRLAQPQHAVERPANTPRRQ